MSLPFTVATTSGAGGRWQPATAAKMVPLHRMRTARRQLNGKKDSTCNLVSPNGVEKAPTFKDKSTSRCGDSGAKVYLPPPAGCGGLAGAAAAGAGGP